jgi:DinB superfamily
MQTRIREVLEHLDSSRRNLRDAVAAVPPERRQAKPSLDAWSVAEVLEHLSIVETNITGLLQRTIGDGREGGLGAETEVSSIVDPRHAAKVMDRTSKIVASEASAPKAGLSSPAAWEALERSREGLCRVIVDADGLALAEVTAQHRVLGPLNAYEWFAFVGNHESRHAAQIRQIGASLDAGSH